MKRTPPSNQFVVDSTGKLVRIVDKNFSLSLKSLTVMTVLGLLFLLSGCCLIIYGYGYLQQYFAGGGFDTSWSTKITIPCYLIIIGIPLWIVGIVFYIGLARTSIWRSNLKSNILFFIFNWLSILNLVFFLGIILFLFVKSI